MKFQLGEINEKLDSEHSEKINRNFIEKKSKLDQLIKLKNQEQEQILQNLKIEKKNQILKNSLENMKNNFNQLKDKKQHLITLINLKNNNSEVSKLKNQLLDILSGINNFKS